jgi:hypothetical protein
MTTLYLHHDQKFNIVTDEDPDNQQTEAGQVLVGESVYQSLGEYRVQGPKGDETRQKILMDDPDPASVTTVEIPQDYEATPTALTHLAETLLDRHAPSAAITGISSPDDPKLAKRLGALMGVDYENTEA